MILWPSHNPFFMKKMKALIDKSYNTNCLNC